MMFNRIVICFVFCGMLFCAFADDVRLIIKYKPMINNVQSDKVNDETTRLKMMEPLSKSQLSILSNYIGGAVVSEIHPLATGAHVIRVSDDLGSKPQNTKFGSDHQAYVKQIINKIKADPSVEYVEEDRLLKKLVATTPNPDWQWDMAGIGFLADEPTWVGDNFILAWQDLVTALPAGYQAGESTIVAVIDTGYTPHPNFLNNLQVLDESGDYGYQFISDCRIAGSCPSSTANSQAENYSYQANGLDLGDYVSQSDINQSNGFFSQYCLENTSSWHGSHVTGIIAANGYSVESSSYITGGAYGTKVVPIRVLGKCGGYDSDIANAIMWAAGYSIPNSDGSESIAGNPNPANVINMSLGGAGSCSDNTQHAISAATTAGAIVVVAAGNEAQNLIGYSPSGCNNVIAVASRGPSQKLSYYSNYGATTIAASGGDRSIDRCTAGSTDCLSDIYSTVWSSKQAYQVESDGGYGTFITYQGTSQATPHVAAAAADVISYLKVLGESYTFNTVKQVLQNSAVSYNNCNGNGCAAGNTLDAQNAISYVASGYVNFILTPSIQALNFDSPGESALITFTNTNESPVTILRLQTTSNGTVIGAFQVNESGTSCNVGVVLAANNGNCVVSLSTVTSSGIIGGELQVITAINNQPVVVSSVSLGYNTGVEAQQSSSTSGGGCSAIKNGDDYSLLFLLIGVSAYAIRRKSITLKSEKA